MHPPLLRLWKLRVLLPRKTRFTRKAATSPPRLASHFAFQCSEVHVLEVWQTRVFHFISAVLFSVFHQVATESVSTASVSNSLVCCIARGTFHCREMIVRDFYTCVFQLWRIWFCVTKSCVQKIVGTDEVDERDLNVCRFFEVNILKSLCFAHVIYPADLQFRCCVWSQAPFALLWLLLWKHCRSHHGSSC